MALIPAFAIRPLMRRIPETVGNGSIAEAAQSRLGAIPREFISKLVIVATLTIVVAIITGPANGFAFVYAESVLSISHHEVALVVALSAFTGIAGLIVGRYLADHLGRRWGFLIGVLGTAATSVLAYSGGRASFILGYMTGVFAAAMLAPPGAALINEAFPHTIRATVGGWVIVAGVIGGILGLMLFGYVGDVAHISATINALRIPAIVTFLPLLPLLGLLRWLPETKGLPIT
jgi:MFS family permease